MQGRQKMIKPVLSSQKKLKPEEPYHEKIAKITIFYRYRIGSIYRQLKIPIYQRLMQDKKMKANKEVKMMVAKQQKSVAEDIETLYKYVSLNSKYHHRQKMRFSRTPLMKYIEFNFAELNDKLKSKNYMKIYDDLEDEDDEGDDEGANEKKEYFKESNFSEQTINNYKKKNSIKGRIVVALGYQDLKERLISEHGWTQNEDHSSLIYDLKFMSKKKDIDYVNLLQGQVVNHFNENKSITAKFGLTRNIRNIVIMGKDHNIFFPRCYDVNDVAELEDFYQDFKYTQLKSLLIQFVNKKQIYKEQIESMKIIINILKKELLSVEQKLDLIKHKQPLYIPIEQWQLIQQFNKNINSQPIHPEELYHEAQTLYNQLVTHDPQFFLNLDNIWIVKPASMSRGRGIKTFNNLTEILSYIIGKQISWVAQKYIERPLIIRRKKFDIRQWVLWTDFKPMRVWIYEQCYIRFCSQIYTPENLKNRKVHLTNNSVTKGINEQNDGIQENMMSEEMFGKQLEDLEKKQIFQTIIKPQMRKIAVESLESVKENVQYRKNTIEIFGYDFMIDENYKVWLIQVNSSPTMEYSTKVTTRLVQKGMSDLADLIQNYVMKGKNYQGQKAQELYGGWKLLTGL